MVSSYCLEVFTVSVNHWIKVKVAQSCPSRVHSLQTHGLYSPWDSPGQKTGVGSLSLLQGIFPTQESNPGLPLCWRTLSQLSPRGSHAPGTQVTVTVSGRRNETETDSGEAAHPPAQLREPATPPSMSSHPPKPQPLSQPHWSSGRG